MAVFLNAQSLHKSAVMLQQNGPWHHALVFAAIGLEEFGKAIIFTAAAIRKEMPDGLPKFADHRTKRYFASRARTTTSGLEKFITELARQPLAVMLRDARKIAPDYYSTGGRGMSAPEWREAALYVDLLPDGAVTNPHKVTLHAEVDVGVLRATLNKYRALPRVLSDSEWTEFAASVRRGLSAEVSKQEGNGER